MAQAPGLPTPAAQSRNNVAYRRTVPVAVPTTASASSAPQRRNALSKPLASEGHSGTGAAKHCHKNADVVKEGMGGASESTQCRGEKRPQAE